MSLYTNDVEKVETKLKRYNVEATNEDSDIELMYNNSIENSWNDENRLDLDYDQEDYNYYIISRAD